MTYTIDKPPTVPPAAPPIIPPVPPVVGEGGGDDGDDNGRDWSKFFSGWENDDHLYDDYISYRRPVAQRPNGLISGPVFRFLSQVAKSARPNRLDDDFRSAEDRIHRALAVAFWPAEFAASILEAVGPGFCHSARYYNPFYIPTTQQWWDSKLGRRNQEAFKVLRDRIREMS